MKWLALPLAVLAGVGCGSKGGGGSFSAIAAATAKKGPDLTPPEVVISQPARGMFLPAGPVLVTGTATDRESGIESVTVQGAKVQLDAKGNFSTTVTVEEGVSPITVIAIDKAGNRTDRTISVETGSYLAASQVVPGALAGRINASGLQLVQQLAGTQLATLSSTIGTSLKSANPIFTGYTIQVSIDSLSFGTPVLAVSTGAQGVAADLTLPQLKLALMVDDTLGFHITTGTITADSATLAVVAHLGMTQTGALDVTFPSANVSFQNFSLTLGGGLSWLAPIVAPLLPQLLQGQIQKLLQAKAPAAIQSFAAQNQTLALGSQQIALTYAIEGIATDQTGLAFVAGIDLGLPPDPSYPASPGSLESLGGVPSSFSTLPTGVFSISETALNRVLHQAWQSGFLGTTISPGAFAQKFHVPLPIGQTGQDLVSFLPALTGVVPQQDLAAPIVYRLRPLLPPTAKIMAGVPDPLRLRFGEYEVTASIDEGNGRFLDVFTVAMYAEIQLGLTIQNGKLVPDMTTLPHPIVASDLVSSPLVPLGAAHIDGYLASVIPALMGGLISNLPPISLPALPAGIQLAGATIHADGANGTYLTIEMELK